MENQIGTSIFLFFRNANESDCTRSGSTFGWIVGLILSHVPADHAVRLKGVVEHLPVPWLEYMQWHDALRKERRFRQ